MGGLVRPNSNRRGQSGCCVMLQGPAKTHCARGGERENSQIKASEPAANGSTEVMKYVVTDCSRGPLTCAPAPASPPTVALPHRPLFASLRSDLYIACLPCPTWQHCADDFLHPRTP